MVPQAATLQARGLPPLGPRDRRDLVAAGRARRSRRAVKIMLGFTPVPISGQTFAVLLVGASYGPVAGASSRLLLYFFVGLLEAPSIPAVTAAGRS